MSAVRREGMFVCMYTTLGRVGSDSSGAGRNHSRKSQLPSPSHFNHWRGTPTVIFGATQTWKAARHLSARSIPAVGSKTPLKESSNARLGYLARRLWADNFSYLTPTLLSDLTISSSSFESVLSTASRPFLLYTNHKRIHRLRWEQCTVPPVANGMIIANLSAKKQQN